jgi:mRNA interferase MazF
VTVRRGEIWYAEVPGAKRRPVVVLTPDSVLPRLTTILVAPITTRIRSIPTEVPIDVMSKARVANLDNITPLPKATLVERAGQLSSDDLIALCAAARFAIGC